MIGAFVRTRLPAVVTLAVAIVSPALVADLRAAQPVPADCQQWEDCRLRALEARERGEHERFHDLAWRAVQTGPRNDPALMYLLARAQALSGRRRDALVMLRRLSDMGVATDAATDEDFRRTRELAGWMEIERRFESLRTAGAAPPAPTPPTDPSPTALNRAGGAPIVPGPTLPAPAVPAPAATAEPSSPALAPSSAAAGAVPPASATITPPIAPAAKAAPAAAARPRAALAIQPRLASDAARFSTDRFAPAGLAYDEVSGRFLFGDMLGRRLFVLGERSDRTIDLVRAEAAGFQDITALEIDTRRGDLWVASTASGPDAGVIHKLQLISGRALTTYESPAGSKVGLVDLAIAANGTLLILDGASTRVLRLRPGATAVESAMTLDVGSAVSLAVGDTDRSAYVAHAGGILRLDLQLRTATPLTAPDGLTLENFERIRWHRNTLVGIQTLPDGMRGLVQLQLKGNAVTAATLIDRSTGRDARPAFLTISGGDAYYSVVDDSTPASDSSKVTVLVRRVQLQ
jgi:hypothetical protein